MKRILSLILCAAMLAGVFSATVFAAEDNDVYAKGLSVTKLSNPDRGQREIDGLLEGGDRGTSYTWRMAERGDDIYIATYRNLMNGVIALFEEALGEQGISSELVWALTDAVTNGELPKAEDDDGAYIIKYNKVTGEFTKVFTFPSLMQCRMVVNFEGDIYAGSFSSVLPRQYLYKIDENDEVTEVFSTSNSFSIRANCVYDPGNGDHLYFAGADEREVLDEGDETRVKVAVWEKDADDDTVWNRVADYKDFYDYTDDEAMKNNTGCPVWELANHNGYIYAGMPYSRGFIIFRGRPAQDGESANEYGWHWEEVVGKNNGINHPGMAADPTGHDDGNFSTIVSVYDFNGELYCFDFDQTIMAALAFVQGGLYMAAGMDVTLSDMIRPVYETLHHTQGLWKLNDETGAFELCEGFDELMDGTCNEYVWRAQEHNGYMYVTTMDSAVIYNYITKLTNGSVSNMTDEELSEQIGYVNRLIDMLEPMTDEDTQKILNFLKAYLNMLEDLRGIEESEPTPEELVEFNDEYSDMPARAERELAPLAADGDDDDSAISNLLKSIRDTYDSIDWEGLEMYSWVSDTVKNDTWGFDMVRTKDGENFEVVTRDGFGDRYNYGSAAFLSTEEGLYVGTCNPFYGGQLYLLTEDDPSVSGTVTSFIDDSEVTLELRGVDNNLAATTVAEDGEYAFDEIPAGTYELKVSKDNHVTRTYEVTVEEDVPVQLNVKICPIGDVTLDGAVTTLDCTMANSHARGVRLITDEYSFACGNVIGDDDEITTMDVTRINSHVRGIQPLWTAD